MQLSERSAAQQHFLQLCQVLGQQTPAEVDPTGAFYTFEKGVQKTGGGQGFADVWLRGYFAWEYKKRHANLAAAYRQLLTYREDLENPPLLVVCDLNQFEVHTNFTNTVGKVYAFSLADLARGEAVAGSWLSPLEVLRALFTNPEQLRPQQTPAQVTETAAKEFAQLATSLHTGGADPEQAAHFLMRLLFCLFAQDIQLLPPQLFTRLVEGARERPAEFGRRLRLLFEAMASGGAFGEHDIAHFNGGLFADDRVLDLRREDVAVLGRACRLNWASVEPAIFGTLFERSLDPTKRAQLGAHYTSRADILLIVEPVLMAPLRQEWTAIQGQAEALIAKRDAAIDRGRRTAQQNELRRLLYGFSTRLAGVRVLDPACGSGNFLYVALKALLDLEKAVITFAARAGLTTWFPQVGPEQLFGIEINPYAHELAQVVVWIGYLQWLHDNGFATVSGTILRRLDNIKEMDAILAFDEEERSVEPEWPEADIIIGNPPFLGGKRLRTALGGRYVEQLFARYDGRVPHEADLVTYWFERAREQIATGRARRVGLLATQGIRGGANRRVLERIKETGAIFMAWADRDWILDGAAVHVSLIGFDSGQEQRRTLDGTPVATINTDLTSATNLTTARRLAENTGIAFQGPVKVGDFDIPDTVGQDMLGQRNLHGRPNSDVVRPWMNGSDITGHARGMWIIDFGERDLEQAALYEAPFEYVRKHIKPVREHNADRQRRTFWWRLGRSGGDLTRAKEGKTRLLLTPRVSKHRLFVWTVVDLVPDSATVAFARDDDYFFGVLHSRPHELWARATGTQVREAESGFRYTPSSTFETFPLPWSPGREPAEDPRVAAIAQAARELVAKRTAWFNLMNASADELKRRTLTNLYNQRPTWLELVHRRLDAAVFDAYGWPHDLTDDDILSRLLALNLERAGMPTAANPD